MIWIVGIATVLMLAGLMWLGLRRAEAEGSGEGTAPDTAIYRDQLAEIERDRARGVLASAEAERTRAEVARRLLAAEDRARAAARPGPAWPALAVFVAMGLGALGLYGWLGAPGYPDMGLEDRIALAEELKAARPLQAAREAALPAWVEPPEAEESYLSLVRQLREAVERRPDDPQGLTLLVRHEAALGNMVAARRAQQRLVDLQGDAAGPQEWLALAGISIEAAGGFVTPEAEHALRQVLDAEPANGPAQYYLGLLMFQTGRPDVTFRIWNRLVRQGPQDAPWVQTILPEMPRVAQLAGVRWEPPVETAPTPPFALPPSSLPGPSAADVEAAGEMSAEDRGEMIRGMVAQLSDRLATEGGSAEEWARLIRALGVLGETDRARAIYAEARETFGAAPEALAAVEAAAESAGIAE